MAPMVRHGRWGEALLESPWRLALVGAWCIYRPLMALRNLAYDRRVLTIRRLPVPVISVGNLTVGGTGKTPLVALLCSRCRAQGRRVAVLSRGYRADLNGTNDEARLLDAPVVCDPDRHAGGRRAIAGGADCLILDDGFQHRRLHRDLDLVCIDATRPFGRDDGHNGALLPLGFLREPRAALRRADAIVVTRTDQVDARRRERLATALATYDRPVFTTCHRAVGLQPLAGGETRPPADLAGRRALVVSAIGHPAAFERLVRDLGAEVVAVERFADHHAYTSAEAQALAARARATGATLLTTAKDAVKLAPLLPGSDALVLTVALVPDDPAGLDRLVASCLDRVAGPRPVP
jgi:tetraacyldisaccharide 4'-kinase